MKFSPFSACGGILQLMNLQVSSLSPVSTLLAGRPQAAASSPSDRFESAVQDPIGARRRELVQLMLDEKTTRPEDQVGLERELSKVGTGALRLAQQEGLSFVTLHPGDELGEVGLLRNQNLEAYQARLGELSEKAAALHEMRSEWRGQLAGADKPEQAAELRRQNRNWLASVLTGNQIPLTVYNAHPHRALYPGAPVDSALNRDSVSLEGMAIVHGARTPEEKQTFYELVAAINGSRLQEAQNEVRQALPESLRPERDEQLAIDPLKHTILVPALYFYGSDENRQLLDEHDVGSLFFWHQDAGRVTDLNSSEDEQFNGQLFYDANKVAVRDRATGSKTPVHELGHALEIFLARRAPEWYESFKTRLDRAYHTAPQAISNYSRANLKEYLAEGFAYFHLQPDRLQAQDPALFKLMAEMAEVAGQLGGINPQLEQAGMKHLSGTHEQLANVLKQAKGSPEQSVSELSQAAGQLRAGVAPALGKVGLETAVQVLQFGMLAGAVDAVLVHTLKQPAGENAALLEKARGLEPASQAQVASEAGQAALRGESPDLVAQFEQAYLAGAALAFKMAG